MSLMSLLKKWGNDGYTIKNEKYQNDNCSFSIYRAKKGRLFSKRILLVDVDDFENTNFDKLVSAIKTVNKKNDLCIAVCGSNQNPDDLKSKTMYMSDLEDGVCIIHFVYYDDDHRYTYDLDFSYYQSKLVKDSILELTE